MAGKYCDESSKKNTESVKRSSQSFSNIEKMQEDYSIKGKKQVKDA